MRSMYANHEKLRRKLEEYYNTKNINLSNSTECKPNHPINAITADIDTCMIWKFNGDSWVHEGNFEEEVGVNYEIFSRS